MNHIYKEDSNVQSTKSLAEARAPQASSANPELVGLSSRNVDET